MHGLELHAYRIRHTGLEVHAYRTGWIQDYPKGGGGGGGGGTSNNVWPHGHDKKGRKGEY